MSKQLLKTGHANIINTPEEREPLQDAEELHLQQKGPPFAEVTGVITKGDQPDQMLWTLTLELLESAYHPSTWKRVYTDGSADQAVENGDSGVLICYQDWKKKPLRSLPAGSITTHYLAKTTALLKATKTLKAENQQPLRNFIVFLADCRSAIQDLLNPREKLERHTYRLLCELSQHSQVTVQCIPPHWGLAGNEEADDRLAKQGSRQKQHNHPISYMECKTLIRSSFQRRFNEKLSSQPEDEMPFLTRQQQTTIFRLRTGQCRVRAHMYRIGLSNAPDSQCETAPHTPEHILQTCTNHQAARVKHWPENRAVQQKLWGTKSDLIKTANLISSVRLEVWRHEEDEERKRRRE